jgi:hypothetical protein
MNGLVGDVDTLDLGNASSLQNATLKLLVNSAETVDVNSYHEVSLWTR